MKADPKITVTLRVGEKCDQDARLEAFNAGCFFGFLTGMVFGAGIFLLVRWGAG